MTFAAAGTQQTSEPTASGSSATFSLTTAGAGHWVFLQLVCNTQAATGVSGGLGTGGTWAQLGTTVSLSTLGAGSGGNIWVGKVVTPGTATVTLSFGGTPGIIRAVSREFSVTSGVIALDVQGSINANTASWASLTPSGAGRLYWGYAKNNSSAVAGSTSGFVFEIDSFSNGEGYCLSVSAAYQPVWGDSTEAAGVMVLVQEVAAGAAPPSRVTATRQAVKRASLW